VQGAATLLAGPREKLGAANSDGTVYRTKSEALTQCANELVELAMAVYWIDITGPPGAFRSQPG